MQHRWQTERVKYNEQCLKLSSFISFSILVFKAKESPDAGASKNV